MRLAAMPPVELDLVYVEATREQLQATLDAIDAQPGEFLSYSVEPAPGVEVQKDWGRQYRRGVEERVRRSGGLLAGKAEDTADAEAVVRAKAPALERQAAEGEAKDQSRAPAQGPSPQGTLRVRLPAGAAKGGFEPGTQQSLGRAWRLQVPGPVLRGRLSASDEDGFALQSGAAVQQAGPAVAAPVAPEASQSLETPGGGPVAERTPELRGPAEGEGKSATPGAQPARSPSQNPSPPAPLTAGGARGGGLGRGSKPPAPAKPAEESPGAAVGSSNQALPGEPGTNQRMVVAPAEQPGKLPGGGAPQDESPKAGSGGRAVGQAAARGGAPGPEKGPAPGEAGSPQPKVPPSQLADKSQEGRRPGEGTSSVPPPQDQAKAKSAPQEKREQRQDLKQQPPPAQTYRVLFVLRMVGPDATHLPAAAAAMMEQAEPPAARDAEGTPPAKKE